MCLIENCILLLKELSGALAATKMPLLPLLCRLQQKPAFAELCFLKETVRAFKQGAPFHKAWQFGLDQGALLPPEREIMGQLGDFLGRTDLPFALDALAHMVKQLTDLQTAVQQDQKQKLRLYPPMGLLAGLFLALLLL